MSKKFQLKISQALDKLGKLDKDIKEAVKFYGYPEERKMPASFETLTRIIIGQQISRKVAEAIWTRLKEENLTITRNIISSNPEKLMRVGLSRRKSEYITGIAKATTEGKLNFDELTKKSGEKIKEQLTSFRGIGDWTADNFRLFALQDFDAWPGGDLALQEAMKILKKLTERPSNIEMNSLSEQWFPYRGAGALMLWHIYARKKRNGKAI